MLPKMLFSARNMKVGEYSQKINYLKVNWMAMEGW